MGKKLKDRVVVVTGSAGLLGREFCKAISREGGHVWGVDLKNSHNADVNWIGDVTDPEAAPSLMAELDRDVYGLVNCAAINPKVEDGLPPGTFENTSLESWRESLSVGLDGAFLFCRTFAPHMADNGEGAIVNMGSVLSVIAPDQRLYEDSVKPASYCVEKWGIVGLTKYLATYYGDRNVRCNTLSPAGVFAGQPGDFVERLSEKIPMGRMCWKGELRGALIYLLTNGYTNGHNLVVDGGYSVW